MLRRKARSMALGLIVGAVSALSVVGAAYAADTVWFYPPVGTWNSYGYPSASTLCYGWSHSIHTYSYRSGGSDPDAYVYYYDVYGGSSGSSTVWWMNHWLVDGHDSGRSKFTSAPYAWSFGNYWGINVNSWFNHYAYGETRFTVPGTYWGCMGISTGVYAPY